VRRPDVRALSADVDNRPAEAAPGSRVLNALVARLTPLALLAALIGLWWYVSTEVLDRTTRALLPPPQAIAVAAWELIRTGDLWRHAVDSLSREIVAFLWALSAVPLGIAMGWWKAVERQVDPIIEMFRPVPPLAWIPLSILWFGVGNTQNEFIIFLGCF